MLNTILAMIILVLVFGFFIARFITAGRIKNKRNGIILIPCSGETENISALVKSYYWDEIFEGENYGKEIVIVCMDGSLNCMLAKRIASKYSIVSCVDIDKLQDFLKAREKSENLNGKANENSGRG